MEQNVNIKLSVKVNVYGNVGNVENYARDEHNVKEALCKKYRLVMDCFRRIE